MTDYIIGPECRNFEAWTGDGICKQCGQCGRIFENGILTAQKFNKNLGFKVLKTKGLKGAVIGRTKIKNVILVKKLKDY